MAAELKPLYENDVAMLIIIDRDVAGNFAFSKLRKRWTNFAAVRRVYHLGQPAFESVIVLVPFPEEQIGQRSATVSFH